MLQERFPKLTFYFVPADATAQTLAGSAQADFEVRLIGRDAGGNAEIARDLRMRSSRFPAHPTWSRGRYEICQPITSRSTACAHCSWA